jgi:hypothetical protein
MATDEGRLLPVVVIRGKNRVRLADVVAIFKGKAA